MFSDLNKVLSQSGTAGHTCSRDVGEYNLPCDLILNCPGEGIQGVIIKIKYSLNI